MDYDDMIMSALRDLESVERYAQSLERDIERCERDCEAHRECAKRLWKAARAVAWDNGDVDELRSLLTTLMPLYGTE